MTDAPEVRQIATADGDDALPAVLDANARSFYRLPPKADPALPPIRPPAAGASGASGAFETKKYSIADLKEIAGE